MVNWNNWAEHCKKNWKYNEFPGGYILRMRHKLDLTPDGDFPRCECGEALERMGDGFLRCPICGKDYNISSFWKGVEV